MNPNTPGYKTSEFAVTIAGVVATTLLSFGIIDQSQYDVVIRIVENIITIVIALLVIYKLIKTYTDGRNSLKLAKINQVNPVDLATKETVIQSPTQPPANQPSL